MDRKSILIPVLVMLFGAGIAVAFSAATPTVISQTRWVSESSNNFTTEGGNITYADISGMLLTDRWAAFFGNVSGAIILGDNANQVFTWSWTAAVGGQICLSTNNAYDFLNAQAASTTDAQALDSGSTFNLGAATDNAAGTFTTADCTLPLNNTNSITGTANVTTAGGFDTCLIKDGATSSKNDFAFCTNINSTGANFEGNPAHYQVIVPTTPAIGSIESYFFYMEMN
jgi:hypothetical protein